MSERLCAVCCNQLTSKQVECCSYLCAGILRRWRDKEERKKENKAKVAERRVATAYGICEHCGGALYTGMRFCSLKCRGLASSKRQATLPRNEIVLKLFDEGLTYREIGERFGVSCARAQQIVKKYHPNWRRRIPIAKPPRPTCVRCGGDLPAHHSVFCSQKCCRQIYRKKYAKYTKQCAECGVTFTTVHSWQVCCSRPCGYMYRSRRIAHAH